MSTGVKRIATPKIVRTDVADADDIRRVSPPRSLKIIHESDVACASALNPTIGSKTLKLSINCIRATNVTRGIK